MDRLLILTFSNLRTEGDVFGGAALDLLLGRHGCGGLAMSYAASFLLD